VLLRSAARGTALLFGSALVCALVLVGVYLLAVRFRAFDDGETEGMSLYRFVVRSQERYPVLALLMDAVWIVLAYYAAYMIRWDPLDLPFELPYFQRTVVIWVGVKVVAFVLSGVYSTPWRSYGLYDALRIQRANLMGTFLAAAALLVIQPVGMSRGVVAIDFLVCSLLTVGARFSFRLIEGTTHRFREDGVPVVVVADVEEAEIAIRQLGRLAEPRLRAVGVASPLSNAGRATVYGLPLFGGQAALRHAIGATGAHAVVLADRPSGDGTVRDALQRYLDVEGALDVYELRVSVQRLASPTAPERPPTRA
jgi:FlaA1/EpsC-like NDP-sugar epimerase